MSVSAEVSSDRQGKSLMMLGARVAAVLLIAAIALLFRPQRGLFGDSRIYVGRAIATLDPAGVGRDLMFKYDHQSAFSIFPALLTQAVALLGPSAATTWVSLVALTAWTLAAAGLVTAFVGKRATLLSLAGVLILPVAYGGFHLGTGEAAPLPRPVAEALVMLGLWALLRERRVLAGGLMAAAAAIHPIMALPGFGVLYIVLCLEDRRWVLLGGIGAALAVAGVALRLPLLDRVALTMDGPWLAVLHACSPSLFLRAWPEEAWSQAVMRAATLGIAVTMLSGQARKVAVATLAVAALALAASALLGDVLSNVFFLQAQVWRALWLLSVLSAAGLPFVAATLWTRGPTARLAAGALICALFSELLLQVSVPASAAALLLVVMSNQRSTMARPLLALGWTLAISGAALVAVAEGLVLFGLVWDVPEPLRQPLHFYLLQDVVRMMAMAAVIAVVAAWRGRGWRRAGWAAAPAAALIFAAALINWRSLEVNARFFESPAAARDVRAVIAPRAGEVLWLGGDLEPLMLAGRPAWWTEVQAASSVFSREQALIWAARRDRLVATGVGPPGLLAAFPHDHPALFWTPSPSQVRAFCALPDAPAWIVQPLRAGVSAPLSAKLWRASIAVPRSVKPDGQAELVAAYAFIPCGPPFTTTGVSGSGLRLTWAQ